MIPAPPAGRVDILTLPAHRLALVRLQGDVAMPQFLQAIAEAHAREPQSAGFDTIIDLRAHTGNIGVEGMKAGKAARAAAWPEPVPSRDVLLTRDPAMPFVARFLDLLAPHVRHLVSADPREAIALATGGPVPEAALAFLAGP